MNFLAHIYLTKSIDHVMLGNFMADSIKGNQYLNYQEQLSKGILLHRFIDSFTDSHELVNENKSLLRNEYGRYSPIVSDIVYDHFLALNFEQYAGIQLNEFVSSVYQYMDLHKTDMTPFAQEVIPYMIQHNWLENYQYKEGLQKIFKQFGRRIGVKELFDNVTEVVWANYSAFENNFHQFFPILDNAVEQKRKDLGLQ